MARTNLAAQTLAGAYPALPLAGGSADFTWTSADVANKNMTALVENKTVLLAHNGGVGAHTITVTSQPDTLNRTGHITAYSIGAGKISRFGAFKAVGWANAGKLEFEADHADVEFAVLQLT
jgi:hypothetical protein